jgi:hypothetical protein
MFAHVSSIEDWKTAVNFLLGRLFSTPPYFGLQILWPAQSGSGQLWLYLGLGLLVQGLLLWLLLHRFNQRLRQ